MLSKESLSMLRDESWEVTIVAVEGNMTSTKRALMWSETREAD